MHAVSRRNFLVGTSAAATSLALSPLSSLVRADPALGPRRFVALYMNGGWDVLLGLDPRHPSDAPAAIDLGTADLAPEYQEPIAVDMAGQATYWGSTMSEVARHADVATLFRGVNMNTVAHPAGRAYVNSFIPPSGVVVKGDSIGTRMTTAGDVDEVVLPNVSIGVPTRNLSFESRFTGVGLGSATDTRDLVEPVVEPLSPETQALLRATQDQTESCVGKFYPGKPAEELAVSRERFRELIDLGLGDEFVFENDVALMERYGITNPAAAAAPSVVGATTWRLLELGLAASVTAQIQVGLDTHQDNWATQQPLRQQAAWDVIAVLLDDLRVDDPTLASTTLVVFSEFARTPAINGRGGRDHWFANSFLVFGGGLRRGVCGATDHDSLGLAEIDIDTGEAAEGGTIIMPEHVGATLAAAAGLPTDDFRVDPLDAWIDA